MLDHGYRIPRYVDHVFAYLDAQDIDKAHFIGDSLGGWVAGRLAAVPRSGSGGSPSSSPSSTVANPEVMKRIRTSTRKAVESDDNGLTRKRLELLIFDPTADVS